MDDNWRKTAGPPCPVCWHEQTIHARANGDDPREPRPEEHMEWHPPPGGPRGQQLTRVDAGYWRCPACDVVLTPREAAVLLDAVLVHGGDPSWIDQAARGGKHGWENVCAAHRAKGRYRRAVGRGV